jgi:hypothetical protein
MTTTALTTTGTSAELLSAGNDLMKWGRTELSAIPGHIMSKGKDWACRGYDVFVRSYNSIPQTSILRHAKIAALALGTLYAAGRAITDFSAANDARTLQNPMGSVSLSLAQAGLNGVGAGLGIAALSCNGAARALASACPLALLAAPLAAFGLRNYASLAIGTHPIIKHTQNGVDNWLVDYDISQGASGPVFLPSYKALRAKLDPWIGIKPMDMTPQRLSYTGVIAGA